MDKKQENIECENPILKDEVAKIEEELSLNSAGKLARKFLFSPITAIIAMFIILVGIIAVSFTPREENPQIDVPSGSVIVAYPGATPEEVQNIIVNPLQRKLNEMTGVDHVYGMAFENFGVVTVAFKVGENKETSLVKLYDRVMHNMDILPKEAMPPLVKPVDIDEVPILTLALSSSKYSDADLYRVAQRLIEPLSVVPNVSVIGIKGGHKKQFNIKMNAAKLAGYNIAPGQIAMALGGASKSYPLGNFEGDKFSLPSSFSGFIASVDDLKNILVASYQGRPIYLKDIADIEEGVDTQEKHTTTITPGVAFKGETSFGKDKVGQVTLYLAKKRSTNAVFVAEDVMKKVEELKSTLPAGVDIITTRNDGHKADEAVNELIFHIFISIAIIVVLLIFTLGWKEALIVAFTVPLILAITLFIGMLVGQTINRITLFALILALGLLVDSAIVVIENIHRHFAMAKEPRDEAVVRATNEIGNPTNIATIAVIFAFLPMMFVTGMMGPYMRPIPFNVPVAMLASLAIAYMFTPWLALKFLKHDGHAEPFDLKKTKIYGFYQKYVRPMLDIRSKRYMFMGGIIALFFISLTLPVFHLVLFKMLPSGNNNTFNITIDLPTGSSIEQTKKTAQCVEGVLAKEAEVADYETFTGMTGVIDFNGLLRGTGMKKGDNVAEIRVNLKDKNDRKEQSAPMVSRMRPMIQGPCQAIADAKIKLVEDPPGPPVVATMVAEIFGGDYDGRMRMAEGIKKLYYETKGIVDIDIFADDAIMKYSIVPDRQKAALVGITTEQIAQTLAMSMGGAVVSVAHIPEEKEQVGIFVRFDKESRNSPEDLANIKLMSMATGRMVPLSEVTKITMVPREGVITSKDLKEITMVTGEMDKRGSVYALADVWSELKNNRFLSDYTFSYDGNPRLALKAKDNKTGEVYDIKWGGEWDITFDVFRDLGGAFGIAVILIFLLMVVYYGNFGIPGIVLSTIPLTFIGVLFGHFIMNFIMPTYFTATSMIGFIALAGIVVRNALLLIDFTIDLLRSGMSLDDAVIEAAATRFKPILLTALAIILASMVIVVDPVWQGLAVSLIFGVLVSTVLTLVVIPLLFWRFVRRKGLHKVLGTNPDQVGLVHLDTKL
jgi:multidrug efflux pump subunit AcrB